MYYSRRKKKKDASGKPVIRLRFAIKYFICGHFLFTSYPKICWTLARSHVMSVQHEQSLGLIPLYTTSPLTRGSDVLDRLSRLWTRASASSRGHRLKKIIICVQLFITYFNAARLNEQKLYLKNSLVWFNGIDKEKIDWTITPFSLKYLQNHNGS